MTNWANFAEEIKRKGDVPLRPAKSEALSDLQKLGVPEDAVAFFREFEPGECADIDGVRLWPIQEVLRENRDFVPGCYIIQHGYVVIATTVFGDAFCFDINATTQQGVPIVLIAHDGYDWDTITGEGIARLKKPTAPDFISFLRAYIDEELDIEPNYDQ